jgi:dihydroflavonol-4-reductase
MVFAFWERKLPAMTGQKQPEKDGSRVLVTGANGFVGSHLAEALLARGYRVRCMVRRSSDLRFIRDLPVEWAYADVQDATALRQACSGVDAVCHCAALTRALDEETFLRVNAGGTAALAQACLDASPGLDRFLFISSHAAAGPSRSADDLLDESQPPRPVTWYGKSKWAAEQALRALGDRLPWTIVRPAAVFGPRDRDFFSYFELVKRGLSLRLGRDERWVSLIYVHDLVDLILLALESEGAVGQTYFGAGAPHTYDQLSAAIAQALGKHPLHVTLPEAILTPIAWVSKIQGRLTGKPALLNDQRVIDMRQLYWLCSSEKAQRELGFAARTDFETAVKETADWYLAHNWL